MEIIKHCKRERPWLTVSRLANLGDWHNQNMYKDLLIKYGLLQVIEPIDKILLKDKRVKQVYIITDKGRRVLRAWENFIEEFKTKQDICLYTSENRCRITGLPCSGLFYSYCPRYQEEQADEWG